VGQQQRRSSQISDLLYSMKIRIMLVDARNRVRSAWVKKGQA